MNDLLALGLGVLLLALNAFFVGAEFALISARRSAIEFRAREGSRRAKVGIVALEDVLEEFVGEIRDGTRSGT